MEKDFDFGSITSLFYFYEKANPKEEEQDEKEKPTHNVWITYLESGGSTGDEKENFYSLSDAQKRYDRLKKDKYVKMQDYNLEKGDIGYYSEDFKHPLYSIELIDKTNSENDRKDDFYEDGTYEKTWGKYDGKEWEILNKELIKELKKEENDKKNT